MTLTLLPDFETRPEAQEEWRTRVTALARSVFAPPSRMSLSEWADAYRFLSADLGEPGQWRTERVPYLREPMDAITDPRVRKVTIRKASRIGATQALLINAAFFYAHQEPAATIIGIPTDQDALRFAKKLLRPAIADTPVIKALIPLEGGKRAKTTLTLMEYPGGSLQLVPTTSPRGMRMVHGRIILLTEVDAYVASAGVDGDPVTLFLKRSLNYGLPKAVLESTPLVKGHSRIDQHFEAGDQRYFHVPCPHCKEWQRLEWGGRGTPYGIKWDHDRNGVALPETAYYLCRHNACVIEERSKVRMVARGEYQAREPARPDRSYHIDALISLFPGARWGILAQEWKDAQRKPEQLRVFVNQVLAESYSDPGQEVSAGSLLARLEAYPVRGEYELVPKGVAILVRTVDTQDDRLETAVWGFGEGEEAWLIDHVVLPGSPGTHTPWRALDLELRKVYDHEAGLPIAPGVTFIDSRGHHAKAVYEYTRLRLRQHVYATFGSNQEGAPLLGRPTRNNAARTILYPIGVSTAKEAVMARLGLVKTPGPGYIHLPDWLDGEQLRQLTAEKLVTHVVKGRPKRVWEKQYERNEMLDLFVYALAALQWFGPATIASLGAIARQLEERGRAEGTVAAQMGSPPKNPARPLGNAFVGVRRQGFVHRW